VVFINCEWRYTFQGLATDFDGGHWMNGNGYQKTMVPIGGANDRRWCLLEAAESHHWFPMTRNGCHWDWLMFPAPGILLVPLLEPSNLTLIRGQPWCHPYNTLPTTGSFASRSAGISRTSSSAVDTSRRSSGKRSAGPATRGAFYWVQALPYLQYQHFILKWWYKSVFILVPVQIAVIVSSLLCSYHITYRFGKGMMPEAYNSRLSIWIGQSNLPVQFIYRT